MSWQSDWQACKNILCIRPDNLGDVIMMTPVFRSLKESLPGIKVTLLTSSVGGKVTPFIRDIDDSIIYDAPWIERETKPEHLSFSRRRESSSLQRFSKDVFPLVNTLQEKQFDAAILLTNYSQNPLPLAFLAYLSGIPKILGYCRELPNHLMNYWVPDTEPFTFPVHGVRRQLRLLAKIGVQTTSDHLSLQINEKTPRKVEKKLLAREINLEKPFLVMHPGVSLKRRQYPNELFIEAGKKLTTELPYQILLTGTDNETTLTEYVQKQLGNSAFSLAGELSLEEFISLIGLADVVISNNTAVVHIAAATGTPIVDLYARSNPEHTPWKVKNRVLYFDIPKKMRTQNTTLLWTTPKESKPMPQPHHIVQAVKELLTNSEETSLPQEMIH